jgi:phospholipase/lecithinase/hemolysin
MNPNTTVPILLDSYFNLVEQVYDSGARRFLFLTVPPTTRSPMISLKDSANIHAAYVSLYNQQLTTRINKLQQVHPDVCA